MARMERESFRNHPLLGWVNSRCFSLTELLVVIAILAVLSSILSPSLTQALSRAEGLECAQNQQQLGSIFMMYTEDHRLLPPVDDKDTEVNGITNEIGTYEDNAEWFVPLGPYVGFDLWEYGTIYKQKATSYQNYYSCPMAAKMLDAGDVSSVDALQLFYKQNSGFVGYGMNDKMAPYNTGDYYAWSKGERRRVRGSMIDPADPNLIRTPAQQFVIGESRYKNLGSMYNIYDVDTLKVPEDNLRAYYKLDFIRHGDISNLLFADGHVESMDSDTVLFRMVTEGDGFFADWSIDYDQLK